MLHTERITGNDRRVRTLTIGLILKWLANRNHDWSLTDLIKCFDSLSILINSF